MNISGCELLRGYQSRPDIFPRIINRPTMENRPDALLFGQREFRCARYPALLKTNGFGGCSILFMYDEQQGLRAGAHFDGYALSAPQVKPSFERIITPRLRSVCGDLSQFKARLIGGIDCNERSERMAEEILMELADLKIDLVELDFGRTCSQGAIIGKDNNVYELTHYSLGNEEALQMRDLSAYYATRNALLRDASSI